MTNNVTNDPTAAVIAQYVLNLEKGAKNTGNTDAVGQGLMNQLESLPPNVLLDTLSDLKAMAPGSGANQFDAGVISASIGRLQKACGDLGLNTDNTPSDVTSVRSFLTDGEGVNLDDLVSLLAKAMIVNSNQQQSNALQDALAAREAARGELMQQAQTLNDEAAKMRAGAIISLVVGVVCAAVSIGMSVVSLRSSFKSLHALEGVKVPEAPTPKTVEGEEDTTFNRGGDVEASETTDVQTQNVETQTQNRVSNSQRQQHIEDEDDLPPDDDVDDAGDKPDPHPDFDKTQWEVDGTKFRGQQGKFDYQMKLIGANETIAGSRQQIGQTINQLGQTVGGAGSTFFQADAKDKEAEGTRDAAEAQSLQAQGDYANSLLQKIGDNAKQIIQFLQAIEESKSDEMRSITRG
jgi:hypothetical protein